MSFEEIQDINVRTVGEQRASTQNTQRDETSNNFIISLIFILNCTYGSV